MKGSWVVHVRCEVIKELCCEDCTEAEAWADPFNFSVDEVEIEQTDWNVMSVGENK